MHALAAAVSLALLAAPMGAWAQAACPGGTTRVEQVNILVQGKTLCAARGGDQWQEFHQAGGSLIDYKRGPGHAVDPSKAVGSWAAADGSSSSLTHTYGSTSYSWLVCQVGAANNYTLVSTATSGTITGASVMAGQVACP